MSTYHYVVKESIVIAQAGRPAIPEMQTWRSAVQGRPRMKKSIPFLVALSLLILSAGGKPAPEPRCFDPWINRMCLSRPKTIKTITGNLQWRYYNIDDTDGLYTAAFYNLNHTQLLLFVSSPGGSISDDDISFAYILRNDDPYDPKIKTLNLKRFRTGRGIYLGMKMSEVENILGTECKDPKKYEGDQGTAIVYHIWPGTERYGNVGCVGKNYQRTLDRYNMPVYHGSYYFKKGSLVKISLDGYP
jgi:hypothetical protein